jgi:nitrogen fixation NifU-like protein
MNERIKGLYQTHILQKSKDERRVGKLSSVTHTLEAYNPMCGDQFTLYLQVDQEKVIDARFEGYGCAISKASTAVLMDFVIGRSIDSIKDQIKEFFELIDVEANRVPEEISQMISCLPLQQLENFQKERPVSH